MSANAGQLEAIKLIGEWCKWCAAVGTAAIAAIGAFFKIERGYILSDAIRIHALLR